MINFAVRKEISKCLFTWFGEIDIVGCMPLTLTTRFNDENSRLEITFSMILQDSTLGHMEQADGAINMLYKMIESKMGQGDGWYVANEIWDWFSRHIKRDVKWLVEGETSESISDEEMERRIKESEENGE
jgi:hypothetical protein